MQDKQDTTCKIQKHKETELELFLNKMVKEKGQKVKVMLKKSGNVY